MAVAYSDLTAAATALDAAERAHASAPDQPFMPSVDREDSLLANVAGTIALERAVFAHLRGDRLAGPRRRRGHPAAAAGTVAGGASDE